MFKRIFWAGLGVAAGVVLVSKAEAYVRANTPKQAREFVFGADQEQVPQRTLAGLLSEFRSALSQRQSDLNKTYMDRFQG